MEQSKRPEWDSYFMQIAVLVSSRSTCLRRKVGAVLVKEKRMLATGYNGTPEGISHCGAKGCIREKNNIPSGQRHELCRGLHAEQNAILQAALHGVNCKGATVYCNFQPCVLCAKMLINLQVNRIVYLGGYPDELSMELLNEAGVNVEKFQGEI